MKLTRWLSCLATDVVVLGGLYLWQVHGIDNAKNVVLVIAWTQAVLGVIGGIAAEKGSLAPRSGLFKAYIFVSCSATVVALAWCGLIALSTTYLIGWLLIEVAHLPPKEAE